MQKKHFITFQTVHAEIRSNLSLTLASAPYFVHDFFKKIILMLYFTNWPNFTIWLPLFLEILGYIYIYIVIISYLACDVINFEINHGFFIKPVSYVTKSSGEKTLISQERRELLIWKEASFIILKGFYWSK